MTPAANKHVNQFQFLHVIFALAASALFVQN